jgi:hypothetical protein
MLYNIASELDFLEITIIRGEVIPEKYEAITLELNNQGRSISETVRNPVGRQQT